MRHAIRMLTVGAALLLGAGACANLDVVNPNNADAARALATPGDVESLIGGAYNSWFNGVYSYSGPTMFLSNASFQHNAPWANAGMEQYGRIPRIGIINDAADGYYGNFTRPWYYSYRAIAAAADGLRSLSDPDIVDALGADVLRDQAYAYFVLGVAHATLATYYDQAFVIDETTDVTEPQEAQSYQDVMTAALGYFDKAISLSGQGSFTIPDAWTSTTGGISNTMLAQICHSEKAQYMAAVARTPAERKAVNWDAVISEVNAGITESWTPFMDDFNGWGQESLDYGGYRGWTESAYYIYGMADQSGNYQRWLSIPLTSKLPNPADGDIVIVTPDTRFPQGGNIADQRTNGRGYFSDADAAHFGTVGNRALAAPSDIGRVWARPERGQWRWSYYRNERASYSYSSTEQEDVPEIPLQQMTLLKAEGLYYKGDLAGAADIINQTRTQYGLNATDAAGTNTSCVPKLPNGSCGGLFEMLKWEKRLEVAFFGLMGDPWFWDGRGWGDLFVGTPLQFPAPCKELQVLQILPCYTFGGSGGEMAAPISTYHYPDEG
jgi:hypothetical protein